MFVLCLKVMMNILIVSVHRRENDAALCSHCKEAAQDHPDAAEAHGRYFFITYDFKTWPEGFDDYISIESEDSSDKWVKARAPAICSPEARRVVYFGHHVMRA